MDADHASSACLSEITIAGFLEHRLPSQAIAAVDAHIDGCASCRLVIVELARASPGASAPASHHATDVCMRADPDDEAVPRGTVVGRFVIAGVLGAGGMGTVYAAYDPELDRTVAIKLLHASIASAADARSSAQLRHEAQVMARIQHSNVVTVHDIGVFRDQVFIAMEHVEGVTLRRWMTDARRRWREIVAMLLHAGDGLASAHDAGVVHGDFKPENVLVGDDGRVRVSDFGIAEIRKHDAAAVTGGTPAYMAPECLRSGSRDARSDQFSFCVTLHEALCGDWPSIARHVEDNTVKLRRGSASRDRRARLPRQLRAVLRRGLAFDPVDRYASMRELLADLRRKLKVRRLVLIAGAVTALVGIAVAATLLVVLGRAGAPERPCSGARTKLAGVWDEPRKIAARSAFLASALPYAPVAFEHMAARLDRYADQWAALRTQACEATEIRHEQSTALLDLRMSCLDDLAIRMRIIADAIAHADGATIRDAAAITGSLRPVDACSDTKALLAVVAPPSDPVTRARIEHLQALITESNALLDAGKPAAASARIGDLDAEITAIGHAPLTARHAFVRARLATWTGDGATARRLFKHAAAEAEAGGIDETKARALLRAAQTAHAAGDREDTERLFGEASATSRRLGMPPEIETELAQGRARAHHDGARYADALSQRQRALALTAQVYGADDFRTANARNDVADTLRALSRIGDALVEAGRATRDLDAALGAEHPDAATAHAMHAMLRFDQGHYAEALTESELAYQRLVAVLGAHHADLAGALTVAGNAHLALHHPDVGIDMLQRAVTTSLEAYEPNHPVIRGTRLTLAQGLLRVHRPRDARRELMRILAAPTRARAPRDFLDGLALVSLGSAALAEGNPRAAIARCEQGIRILQATLGRRNVETAAALGELGHAVSRFDPRRAVQLLEEAAQTEVAILGAGDPRTAIDRSRLGKLLYQIGDRARGRRLIAEVHDLLVSLDERFDSAELAVWLTRHAAVGH